MSNSTFYPFCTAPVMSNYNLSGSISFDGFHPPSQPSYSPNGINSTWTLNTAVHYVQNFTANYSQMYQSFWLDTSPQVKLSAATLPYLGCAISLYGGSFSEKKIPDGVNAESSCDSVLSHDCQNAIMSIVNSVATSQIGGNISDPCGIIFDHLLHPPKGCPSNAYQGMNSLEAIGNPAFLHPDANQSCNGDVGSGNASSAMIAQIFPPDYDVPSWPPANDTGDYTLAGSSAYGIILTAWAKQGSLDVNTSTLVGFSDSKMLCVSPDKVQPGSQPIPSVNGERILRANVRLVLVVVAVIGVHLI